MSHTESLIIPMFQELQIINQRPAVFEHYTASELWTDEHTSSRMLEYHLDGSVDISSRKTDFIERSVTWIANRFGLGQSKSMIDLGCGPGLYSIRAAGFGAQVTAVDFSQRSISYARQQAELKHLPVEYVCDNYLEFQPAGSFDLATMIMCDFCALSPKQRRRLLNNIRGYLKPRGYFLFDVYSLCAFEKRTEQATYEPNLLDGFWSARPYFGFLNTFKYQSEHVVLDKYTIVEEARTRVVYNWLQYYDRDSLTRELDSSGFQVTELLGNVCGDSFGENSQEFAIVAQVA